MSKIEWWEKLASIGQAVATMLALALGAWWFFEQRQTHPHGQLEQSLQVVPVKPGLIAVEAHVQFDNKGMTKVQLQSANVKLQNVSDQPYQYRDLAALKEGSYWRANRPVGGSNNPQFTEGELRWPILNQFKGPIDHLVEPGETDLLVFTFLVPCESLSSDKSTKTHFVRVASDIAKPHSAGEEDVDWKARTFVEVANACNGKGVAK